MYSFISYEQYQELALCEAYEVQEEFEKIIDELSHDKHFEENKIYYIRDLVNISNYTILKDFIKNGIAFMIKHINADYGLASVNCYISPQNYKYIKKYDRYYDPNVNMKTCPLGIIYVAKSPNDKAYGHNMYPKNIWGSTYAKKSSEFAHELRHAYNNYVSHGKTAEEMLRDVDKYWPTKTLFNKTKKYSPKTLSQVNNKLLTNKEEISAWLAGVTNELSWYKIEWEKPITMMPFSEIVEKAKTLHGMEYDDLSPEKQKRVIRKLAQIWHIKQEKLPEFQKLK